MSINITTIYRRRKQWVIRVENRNYGCAKSFLASQLLQRRLPYDNIKKWLPSENSCRFIHFGEAKSFSSADSTQSKPYDDHDKCNICRIFVEEKKFARQKVFYSFYGFGLTLQMTKVMEKTSWKWKKKRRSP